jgi:hypothetical protein
MGKCLGKSLSLGRMVLSSVPMNLQANPNFGKLRSPSAQKKLEATLGLLQPLVSLGGPCAQMYICYIIQESGAGKMLHEDPSFSTLQVLQVRCSHCLKLYCKALRLDIDCSRCQRCLPLPACHRVLCNVPLHVRMSQTKSLPFQLVSLCLRGGTVVKIASQDWPRSLQGRGLSLRW